ASRVPAVLPAGPPPTMMMSKNSAIRKSDCPPTVNHVPGSCQQENEEDRSYRSYRSSGVAESKSGSPVGRDCARVATWSLPEGAPFGRGTSKELQNSRAGHRLDSIALA